jgi:REP element-mobilizing transposase RayT
MKKAVREMLFPYIGGIIKGLGGTVMTVGGMPDHVHIVARLPTNVSVADAVRTVKSNSSRWMNERSGDMKFGWQRGYSAFSVSQSAVPIVARYVQNQERHHRRRSFRQELRILLAKHDLCFEERFLC